MIADQEGRNEGRTCGGVAVRVIAEPIGGSKTAMPAIYGQSFCLRSAGMRRRRFFVAKTQWYIRL